MVTSVVSARKDVSYLPGSRQSQSERKLAICLVTALTAFALFLHGYHPFAEDGGLYLSGIKRILTPSMYPHETGFVLGHLRFSLFAPAMAALVRLSGIHLEVLLLLVYLACIWMTLWAGWLLAERCFQGRARMASVALLATWLTLPVAGTSLMVMDPYVTARSISTPCTLLALVFMLDFLRYWQEDGEYHQPSLVKIAAAFVIAALMHPLMAAYGFGCVLMLSLSMLRRQRSWWIAVAAFSIAAIAVAALLRTFAQPESSDYRQVAMSRYYWFLSEWHWYEWLGLLGPMAILGYAGFARKNRRDYASTALAQMCVATGLIACLVALLFARRDATPLLVARLQPLRIFQTIYIIMILFVGAGLSFLLGERKLRWAMTFAALAAIMFFAESGVFPASAHIEWPLKPQKNAWVQAFEWIRNNTPQDALFALDADYITHPGEDAQSFRAIAERSVLPDYSKDGGEAAITPSLTEEWRMGQRLQSRLSEQSDRDRIAALRPAGVNWIVLEHNAVTSFPCDYANTAVKVCRLPPSGLSAQLQSHPAPSVRPIGSKR